MWPFHIDLILNRTLVYVPLTAILAGLYSASITFSQRVFIAATGQKSDAAIALTTLVMASAFTPLKNHLQSVVDRRFKEIPDPGTLMEALNQRVQTRVFSVDERKITRRLLEEAVAAFYARCGAVFWGEGLDQERLHATWEWNGQDEIHVPLQTSPGGIILGFVCLGPRLSGVEYTSKDRQKLHEPAQVVAEAIEQDRR